MQQHPGKGLVQHHCWQRARETQTENRRSTTSQIAASSVWPLAFGVYSSRLRLTAGTFKSNMAHEPKEIASATAVVGTARRPCKRLLSDGFSHDSGHICSAESGQQGGEVDAQRHP